MSEFRRDDVSGRWVIIAPERAARPNDFPVERRRPVGGFCPFCEGHEDKTPPELAAVRPNGSPANAPGWRVRVVPNRFPALHADTPLRACVGGIEKCMTGFGIHEVIIDTPRHVLSMCEVDPAAGKDVLLVYRDRMLNLRRDERIAYGMIFKNVGVSAGATLEHSHTQLIGLPVVPNTVRDELTNCRKYARAHNACIFCRIIEDELAARSRVIYDSADFVCLAPFASRSPFETWIVPKKHVPRFEEHPADTFGDLADVLCTVLGRLDAALDRPAYNYLIHTAPFGPKEEEQYHWHIEIIPSVTRMAGFEWGTGVHINPVSPESAATFLGEHRA